MERLADALERNAEEIQSFKEFLKPEFSITETIKRKKQELFNARNDAELFTRGLQEQLRRRKNNEKADSIRKRR